MTVEKQPIFISQSLNDMRYVRLIQVYLEDVGYRTYTLELARSFSAEVGMDTAVSALLNEFDSSVETVLHVSSSIFDRVKAHEMASTLRNLGKTVYLLDIDDLYNHTDIDEKAYLTRAVHHALQGHDSQHWHRQEFNEREEALLKILSNLPHILDHWDDEQIWEILADTRGAIISVAFFAELEKIVEFTDAQRMRFNRALEKFHYFPPYRPKETIFLSHNTRNLAYVRRLQWILEARGHRTFVFRLGSYELADLSSDQTQQDVLDVIASEIFSDAVDWLMTVRTPDFKNSAWTLIEQDFAVRAKKPVYSIDISEAMELDLHTEATFQALRQSVEAALQNGPLDFDIVTTLPWTDLKYILLAQKVVENFDNLPDDDIVKLMVERPGLINAVWYTTVHEAHQGPALTRAQNGRLNVLICRALPDSPFCPPEGEG